MDRGDGCPTCGKRRKTSFVEQAIFFYLQKCSWDVKNNCLDPYGNSVDVLLPERKIVIEYDSLYYHLTTKQCGEEGALAKAREKHLKLSQYYRVYVLTEWDSEVNALLMLNAPFIIPIAVPVYAYTKKIVSIYNQKIYELLRLVLPEEKNYPNIDIQRDELKILEQYVNEPINGNFQELHPQLAKDWDRVHNGTLTPNMFLPSTPYRFYWVCRKCKRSYQMSMNNRLKVKPDTCPFCCRKSRYPSSMLCECYPQLSYFWNKSLNEHSFYEVTVASEQNGIFNGPEGRVLSIRICHFSDWLWNHPDKRPEDYLILQVERQRKAQQKWFLESKVRHPSSRRTCAPGTVPAVAGVPITPK